MDRGICGFIIIVLVVASVFLAVGFLPRREKPEPKPEIKEEKSPPPPPVKLYYFERVTVYEKVLNTRLFREHIGYVILDNGLAIQFDYDAYVNIEEGYMISVFYWSSDLFPHTRKWMEVWKEDKLIGEFRCWNRYGL